MTTATSTAMIITTITMTTTPAAIPPMSLPPPPPPLVSLGGPTPGPGRQWRQLVTSIGTGRYLHACWHIANHVSKTATWSELQKAVSRILQLSRSLSRAVSKALVGIVVCWLTVVVHMMKLPWSLGQPPCERQGQREGFSSHLGLIVKLSWNSPLASKPVKQETHKNFYPRQQTYEC